MLCMKRPSGQMTKNLVVLTSMRRDDVASMLIRRHFGTICPLGRVDPDCTILSVSTFLLDTLKDEKERLISLYKCTDKFEY